MKKLKVNKKILNIVVLILVVTVTSVVTVFAERIIASSTVTYSNSSSGLASTNVQGALDELYGKAKCLSSITFAEFLKNCLPASETVIADDGTEDHNMRYMGKTPNNYITFNGELWRVIGVFNNVDNGTGTKETRVKIIKAESIGTKAWDSSNKNNWAGASLNTELKSSIYASNSMVDNAVWPLGGMGSSGQTLSTYYVSERGTTVYSGNDVTWTGKVGLMYASDYGFASSACYNDSSLLLNNYSSANKCIESNWLYLDSAEWLLGPPYSDDAISSRQVGWGDNCGGSTGARYYCPQSGYVTYKSTNYSSEVRPAVFLKSSVTCKNCSDSTAGTQANPFQIG